MRVKTLAILSFTIFILSAFVSGGYAYSNRDKDFSQAQFTLPVAFTEEEQEQAMIEKFIAEKEEERPEGLTESTIATGSRYDGITYNNVQPASNSNHKDVTAKNEENTDNEDKKTNQTDTNTNSAKTNEDSKNQTNNDDSIWISTGEQKVGIPTVTDSPLNLRGSAGMDGEILGALYNTDTVLVVGKSGNWYQVVTEDGIKGYVSADYLKIID